MKLSLSTMSNRLSSWQLQQSLKNFFVSDFDKCRAPDVRCQLVKARNLRNIGNMEVREALMANILKQLEQSRVQREVRLTLIQSLATWSSTMSSTMMMRLKSTLMNLISWEKEETTLRIAAAELVFMLKPDEVDVVNILEVVKEDQEMLAFTTNRLVEFSQRDPHVKQILGRLWSKGVLNWNLFAHGGLSSSFNRTLATMEGERASFSFGFHMLGPMFKRSQFNVELKDKENNSLNVLELNVFAGGLWSMVSDLPVPKEERDVEAHGGMELRILDNSLRPFRFFESTADLMAIYWSGQAEEKNSALQGSQKVAEHRLLRTLSNGQVVLTRLNGAISYDFGGQASLSMWEKTAETVVETAAALVVDLDTSIVSSRASTSSRLWTEAQLNLETDINFGGEVSQLCIRMHVPPFNVFEVKKSDTKRTTTVSGRTLYLNEKNNELCNQMNKVKT